MFSRALGIPTPVLDEGELCVCSLSLSVFFKYIYFVLKCILYLKYTCIWGLFIIVYCHT